MFNGWAGGGFADEGWQHRTVADTMYDFTLDSPQDGLFGINSEIHWEDEGVGHSAHDFFKFEFVQFGATEIPILLQNMHIAGPLWALALVALVANAACMHALSASGTEAHADAAFVTPRVPLRVHANSVPQCGARPRPARPFAKTGTHTTVMAVGGKGGGRPQQRGGGGRQDKTDGLPNADR